MQSVPRMPRRVQSNVLGVGSRNTKCKDLNVSALMVFAVGMSATAAVSQQQLFIQLRSNIIAVLFLTHLQLLDGYISAPRSRRQQPRLRC